MIVVVLVGGLAALATASLPAQDVPPAEPVTEQTVLETKFAEQLQGVKFLGKFTITGRDNDHAAVEEYTILSVKKLPPQELWLFQARIKYGTTDVTLPLPLAVKWAGDTPVITLTNLTIPGLGTFGARVVIHDGKYAGTWSHGDVGGHLFGTIKKLEAAELKSEEKPKRP